MNNILTNSKQKILKYEMGTPAMTTYSRGRAVINLVDRSVDHRQYFHSWCCANSFLAVVRCRPFSTTEAVPSRFDHS